MINRKTFIIKSSEAVSHLSSGDLQSPGAVRVGAGHLDVIAAVRDQLDLGLHGLHALPAGGLHDRLVAGAGELLSQTAGVSVDNGLGVLHAGAQAVGVHGGAVALLAGGGLAAAQGVQG